MTVPKWVNERKYKIHRMPNGSANVVHFSPGPSPRRKTVIKVPKNKASNIAAYLRQHFTRPSLLILPRNSYNYAKPKTRKTSPNWMKSLSETLANEKKSLRRNISARKKIIVPYELNCTASASLYQNVTNNGRTGHLLTKASSSKRLGTNFNVTLGPKRIRRGVAVLGHGKQAVVYLGCTDNKCKQQLIIKVSPFDRAFPQEQQPPEYEFRIHRQIFKLVPKHVTAMYSLKRCRDFAPLNAFTSKRNTEFDYEHQTVSFGEYLHGGELENWLDKLKKRVTDDDIASLISQILRTLQKIQGRYPNFRHHDLHLQNVLVDDTGSFPRLAISDFGLAQISKTDPNPMIARGFYNSSGITLDTDPKYDQHYFLNSMYAHLRSWSGIPKTMAFLNYALPGEFKGADTIHCMHWRLRAGTNTRAIPTLRALLNHPYIAFTKNSPSLSRSISTPRELVRTYTYTATSPNVPSPTALRGVSAPRRGSSGNAADIARTMLSGNSSVNVSVATSVRPSAKNFLKLSPASRAALKRPGNAAVKPKLVKFNVKPRVTVAPSVMVRASPKRVTRAMMKNNRFNRMVLNAISPENRGSYNSRWNRARIRVLNQMEGRLRRGESPFSGAGPSVPPRGSPRTLMNNFIKAHPRATRKNVETHLISKGFSRESARRAIGQARTPVRTAIRRSGLNLVKSPGGRVRAGGRLLMSRTKAELVNMARQSGMTRNLNSMTKQQIVNALYG